MKDEMRANSRNLSLLLGVAVCTLCDQWTKAWVRKLLTLKVSHGVTPFLTLVYAWNPGISFGLFPCTSSSATYLLLALIFLFMGMLWHWYSASSSSWQRWGLMMVIGGAFSNALDRLFFRAVFDFIRFHWGNWAFPACNLADMLITMGFLVLMSRNFR